MSENQTDEWLKNLPLQTEDIAFKSEEMIACEQCARTNPPNRLQCLYCGAELEISEAQSEYLKPNLRKLESWEKGFNLIFAPADLIGGETKIEDAAKLLKTEREILHKIFESKKTLPLARVESEKEAEILRKLLSELGVETRVVSDEDLAVEKPSRRLRGIEFDDDHLILILFNQDEIVRVAKEDLILIVAGATFERRIEATEKYNKKGENKILDQTETASDETLIDIYSRADDRIGWRVLEKGFDFSGLENEKGILAKDNIVKLGERLRRFAPDARFVDDYAQIRELLADVWTVEQKVDSQGLKRESFGKFNLGNVTMVGNQSQFTKYSRLCRQML